MGKGCPQPPGEGQREREGRQKRERFPTASQAGFFPSIALTLPFINILMAQSVLDLMNKYFISS